MVLFGSPLANYLTKDFSRLTEFIMHITEPQMTGTDQLIPPSVLRITLNKRISQFIKGMITLAMFLFVFLPNPINKWKS